MKQRKIEKVESSPFHRGFLGEGHLAKAVVDGQNYSYTDPFMLLMDDRLDLPGGSPVGGAHPHGGFETVTLVLKGDDKLWKTGSIELMTAGKGVVHTEEISSKTNLHILQLWLVLSPEKRWVEPSWQQILKEDVPLYISGDNEIRVYSGSSNGINSPLKNYTPFTLVDFRLVADVTFAQSIPANYNGFVYVLEGSIHVGDDNISEGQTGWLEHIQSREETEMTFHSGAEGARFIFYAAEPHGATVVSHGPFIGDTQEDIARLYTEYRAGKIPHLNDMAESNKTYHRSINVNQW